MQEIKPYPPKFFLRFFRWYCHPRLADDIEGDLIEVYRKRVKKKGKRYADFRFVIDVLLLFRPGIIRPPEGYKNSNNYGMYKSYFKVGWRNLLRNKGYSTINITGLAIGMAACFLIIQYVHFELSYDEFHQKKDRIYRVILKTPEGGSATNNPGAGPALKYEFPEVKEYARIVHQGIFSDGVTAWSYVDKNGDMKVFNEERVYNVDPSFLTMFSFPFVYGNPESAFPNMSSVVIAESVAKKFFGQEDPLGRTLIRDGEKPFTVTGVFKDVPENSHIKFDILVSYFMTDAWGGGWDHSWDWKWAEYFTYVLLSPDAQIEKIEARLGEFNEKYLNKYNEITNQKNAVQLEAVEDIHLRSPNLRKEQEVHGNESTIYVLLVVAGLILLIAWINYINLSTSRSAERSREVGIRKVAGASRKQLIFQFLFDSAMLNVLAIATAFVLIIAALPYFNQLTGKNIGAGLKELHLLNEPTFWVALTVLFLSGSFFAGLYPAVVLSSFRTVNVLKGKLFGSKSGIVLRKILVGSQFAISVALIAGTIVVYRQVSFMRNQELGYVQNQLLVVKSPRVLDSIAFTRKEVFKTELKRHADIHNVASTSEVPGKLIPKLNGIQKIDDGADERQSVYHFYMDKDFITTYGIKLLAGRNFNENDKLGNEEERDKRAVPLIVNEKTIHSLGFPNPEEALNQFVYFGLGTRDWTGQIVGIIENYHQQSLKGEYDPLLFFPAPNSIGKYITINMNIHDPQKLITSIRNQFEMNFPGNEFEYFFLDDFFDRQYAAERQFGKVFGLFSGLALFVASLGLFGLSTFIISQRKKEIAIRKVLGATISGLVGLFSRDFIRLILIANLIALPIIYFIVEGWLNSFAFRINIGWTIFVLPSFILLIISLATVSVQTIKTGLTNPVKSLRSE